jgi:hypothetical protein
VAVLLASLAGAVVLNVLKEEVPEERSGDSRAFASAVPSSSSLGCNRFAGDSDGIAR